MSGSKDTVRPITEILGMSARDIEVAVKGWSCLSGEFKLDYDKLQKLCNFSSAKTASNQWRITKKKLDTLDKANAGAAGTTADAKHAAPKRKAAVMKNDDDDDDDGEDEEMDELAPKRAVKGKRAGVQKQLPEEEIAVEDEVVNVKHEAFEEEITVKETAAEEAKPPRKRGRPAKKTAVAAAAAAKSAAGDNAGEDEADTNGAVKTANVPKKRVTRVKKLWADMVAESAEKEGEPEMAEGEVKTEMDEA